MDIPKKVSFGQNQIHHITAIEANAIDRQQLMMRRPQTLKQHFVKNCHAIATLGDTNHNLSRAATTVIVAASKMLDVFNQKLDLAQEHLNHSNSLFKQLVAVSSAERSTGLINREARMIQRKLHDVKASVITSRLPLEEQIKLAGYIDQLLGKAGDCQAKALHIKPLD